MATKVIDVCNKCGKQGRLNPCKIVVPGARYVGLYCKACTRHLEQSAARDWCAEKKLSPGRRAGAQSQTIEEEVLDILIGA